MSQAEIQDLLNTSKPVATEIQDRLSKDLVFALVGPVGSGVTTAADIIQKTLTQDFSYKVCPIIKPSKIIAQEARRVGITLPQNTALGGYIDAMQTAGNKLREKFGPNYLAEKAVEKIHAHKKEQGDFSDKGLPLPARRAYLIDSIKNTEELSLLRQIYQETLVVIGVFAPDEMRRQRLLDNGASDIDVQKIIDRDEGEVMTFGQKTRKVFVGSDVFFCNDQKEDELERRIKRFLDIIFDSHIHTPTRDEAAMYKASSAAAKSACMSRQVGASIFSDKGELISVGWNDVPKFGGSLYSEDDQSTWNTNAGAVLDKDHRCFKWEQKICHNEIRKKNIANDIAIKIEKAKLLKRGKNASDIMSALSGTEIESLIEFSRSIHAEMEAILAVAREGRHSLVGATLYTTTYPCHNCARHIVASGIKAVYYIEPYAKSLATPLHSDAISENPLHTDKVIFRQYDGIAPRNYHRLFRPNTERKLHGRLNVKNRKTSVPVFRIPLDSPVEYEAKVIADLDEKEHNKAD